MKPVNLKKLTAVNSPKFTFCTCWCTSFSVMSTIQELSLLCLLMTLHRGQIRDRWDGQVVVIGPSLYTNSIIHQSLYLGLCLSLPEGGPNLRPSTRHSPGAPCSRHWNQFLKRIKHRNPASTHKVTEHIYICSTRIFQ